MKYVLLGVIKYSVQDCRELYILNTGETACNTEEKQTGFLLHPHYNITQLQPDIHTLYVS